MALGKRIRTLRLERGLTLASLCSAIGLKNTSTIQTAENKDSSGCIHAEKIANYFGVNLDWLITGKGEKYANKNNTKISNIHKTRSYVSEEISTCKDSPLVNINQYHDVHAAMGTGLLLPDNNGQITGMTADKEWINKNVPANTGPHNLRIVTGFGDSMKGMFNSGDPLLVDSGVKEINYDGVYFFRVNDEGFIKRLQRIPGNGITVISSNKEYRDWTITNDMDFEVFGRVLKVWNGSET